VATRYVTTTYGIDHLTARIVSFLVLVGALLALTAGGFVGFFRRNRA
jgi:LPXTG-motif cell wall-anchored protein